jgi:hypothetical protein
MNKKGAASSNGAELQHIRELLPPKAILLPGKRNKQPIYTGWPKFTYKDSQSLECLADLSKAETICVLLGPNSDDTITIDFDEPGEIEAFLKDHSICSLKSADGRNKTVGWSNLVPDSRRRISRT